MTTATKAAAPTFDLDPQHPHAFRYARAAEHVEVVKTLQGSFEDDAFIHDKKSGQSKDWRGLAATIAEVIFTARQHPDTAQEFHRDGKARARGLGRNPDHILIMPGVSPLVGRTEAAAREKSDRLTGLILKDDGIGLIRGLTGVDLDGPLPPVEPTEGMKSRQALIGAIADKNGFAIPQLYRHAASARGHHIIVGMPEQIADTLEAWFRNDGADGVSILPPWLPTGPTDCVDLVIPQQ